MSASLRARLQACNGEQTDIPETWVAGIMLLNTCQAMGEMAIMYPVSGGFYTLVSRFIDPSWGFAMG